MKRFTLAIAALAATASLAFGEDRAAATTFCVPTFSAACANSGGNVAEADLEKAMGLNATDGVADQIFVAPGTITETGSFEPSTGFKNPGSIEPTGSDPLTVIGAGAGVTTVTSVGTQNIYLLELGATGNTRKITVRDLTLQIPTSFPDGGGAGAQLVAGDTFERVDVVSLNKGSDGVGTNGAGNLVVGGEITGAGAEGSVDDALRSASGGTLTVEGTLVVGASWGLIAQEGSTLTATRVVETGTRTYGAICTGAGSLTVTNSVFELDDAYAFSSSSSGPADCSLTADAITAVNSGGATVPAMYLGKTAGAGKVTMNVSNSILRGFKSGYQVEAGAGPGIGTATLTASYSNFQKTGTSTGLLNVATGNIDADPLFNPDLTLPPTSPSVDAGDPAAGGLAVDFLGAPRPNDGNGDGTAIRDQGAFEYQRPKPPTEGAGGGAGGAGGSGSGGGGEPVPPADRRAPQTKLKAGPGAGLADGKAKFRFASDEPGSRFECKLDKGKRRPCRAPKSYSGLKPGAHSFEVWAIDAAGNVDPSPAKRGFNVPG